MLSHKQESVLRGASPKSTPLCRPCITKKESGVTMLAGCRATLLLLLMSLLSSPTSSFHFPALRPPSRARCSRTCTAPYMSAGKGGGGGDLGMGVLLKRMEEIREQEEGLNRAANRNWMQGLCSHRTAAVINDWIRKLKFFEDTVALGTYQGNVFMVDMNTREIKSRLDGHTDEISAIDWDGAVLATGSLDSSVRVWKRISLFETPEEGQVGPDGEPYRVHGESESIVFHHSGAVTGLSLAGRELVTCSLDSTIRVWDTLTDRCLHIIKVGAPVTSVACSSEDVPFGTSRYCAAGTEDGTINIYSMESWKLVLSWKAHKGAITSMWSDGQNELVTGGHDGWIKVWDLFDGFGSGKQLGIQAHNGPVASVQADGVKIVSGGLDGAVRVWKKDSGAGILEISGHTAYLGSVQFEGHKLVADGTNNVCVLHDFRDSEYVEGDIFWMEDE